MAYLFEWPNNREAQTIRRLLGGPHCAYDYFWTTLGVRYPAWFGINLPKRTLLGQFGSGDRRYDGDIDILVGGGLSSGYNEWQPLADEWAAIEVKVSWYGQLDVPKATKERRLRRARGQAHD